MKTIQADLLSIPRGIIVHGCNCQGVMGAGVAKGVKAVYPSAYATYRNAYEERGLYLGEIIPVQVAEEKWIINAMTQLNYGLGKCQIDYEALQKCFSSVRELAESYGLPVFYPLIGAGRGGGDWNIISAIIDKELFGLDHTLCVHV